MVKSFTKTLIGIFALIMSLQFVAAAVNVVDVEITEDVYQAITFNPLSAGSGSFYGPGEDQTAYTITGKVIVRNNHPTDSVNNVVVNLTGISNTSGLVFDSGSAGVVSSVDVGGDFAILTIGDLANGSNSTFNYTVTATNIEPFLNLEPSYNANVFSGLAVSVTDVVENQMNSTLYPENCLYDINIVQDALTLNDSGILRNFTFDNSTLTGGDASNASFSADNRTLTWNFQNSGCLNAGETNNISFDVNSPTAVASAQDYFMTNSTITYSVNTSISRMSVASIGAITDLEVSFEKYQVNILNGDNATWQITADVLSQSDITVNLTSVTLWVSQRNGTGTGFTNPSLVDVDTVSGENLTTAYIPNVFLNSSLDAWNNTGSEWLFNYTFSSSPIVWMDLENNVVDDSVQLTDRSITYGADEIYVKEIYVATGYWLEITKNITRLSEASYNILISVANLGTSPTPNSQVVVVYNFLPVLFTLDTPFSFQSSPWYTSEETNTTLNDVVYNGTMYQYGIIPNANPSNSSLDFYGGAANQNNTWSVTYNISGTGEFNFDDLFLTGVDPLNVQEVGATKSLSVENMYKILSAKGEYILSGLAVLIGILLFIF